MNNSRLRNTQHFIFAYQFISRLEWRIIITRRYSMICWTIYVCVDVSLNKSGDLEDIVRDCFVVSSYNSCGVILPYLYFSFVFSLLKLGKVKLMDIALQCRGILFRMKEIWDMFSRLYDKEVVLRAPFGGFHRRSLLYSLTHYSFHICGESFEQRGLR